MRLDTGIPETHTTEDIYGKALLEYWAGEARGPLETWSDVSGHDEMPLEHLFRDWSGMPPLERIALEAAKGHVLDVGAGAGGHSLYLQEVRDLEVTALDRSPGAVATCRARGVRDVRCAALSEFRGGRFDTVLLPMNGIGMAGRRSDLEAFLARLARMLAPGGQILLDSTDLRYLYPSDADGQVTLPGGAYYGEVLFRFGYDGAWGPVFPWLYVDPATLYDAAEDTGLKAELLAEGEHYDYLARMVLRRDTTGP